MGRDGRGERGAGERRQMRGPERSSTEAAGRALDAVALTSIATMATVSRMTTEPENPDDLLPLPPATFHILLALADEDRHGYAIIQDVEARTGGELRLSAGTLYRSIQRMLEQGLLVETRERPPAEEDDERRRYYRITALGTAVAKAEAPRLPPLVRVARARGFRPGRGRIAG